MVLMLLPTSVIWIAAKLVLLITGNFEVQRQVFSYIMFMLVLYKKYMVLSRRDMEMIVP